MVARNEERFKCPRRERDPRPATGVASTDIDLLPQKFCAFDLSGTRGGEKEEEEERKEFPSNSSSSPETFSFCGCSRDSLRFRWWTLSETPLSERNASEYSSGAEVERSKGRKMGNSSSFCFSLFSSFSSSSSSSSMSLSFSFSGGCGEKRCCSSSMVRRELRLPPLFKLFNEFEVDKGPKRHEAQDKGRSFVAIKEIRECLTISGRRRIVSKICSFVTGGEVATTASGELGTEEEEKEIAAEDFPPPRKLIALSGSSFVAESEFEWRLWPAHVTKCGGHLFSRSGG